MSDRFVRRTLQRAPTDDGVCGVLLDLVDDSDLSGDEGTSIAHEFPALLWTTLRRLLLPQRELLMWTPHDSSLSQDWRRRPLGRRDLSWMSRQLSTRACEPQTYPLSFWVIDSNRRQACFDVIDQASVDRMDPSLMATAIEHAICRVAVFRSSITASCSPLHHAEVVAAVDATLESEAIGVLRDD